MPAEVYKKPLVREGRFTAAIDHLQGQDLEFVGIETRFFTYGRGFVSVADEQKRIRLRQPVNADLTRPCAIPLSSPP